MLDDLSYAAGLIDGEGCIGFHGYGDGKRRFVVKVKMTDEAVIDWLQSTFGGYKHFEAKAKPHHKDQWCWRLQNGEAKEFYRRLRPLLKIKNKIEV